MALNMVANPLRELGPDPWAVLKPWISKWGWTCTKTVTRHPETQLIESVVESWEPSLRAKLEFTVWLLGLMDEECRAWMAAEVGWTLLELEGFQLEWESMLEKLMAA